MTPPSMPVWVTTASPRRSVSPRWRAMRLRGWPAKRVRKWSDQATVKPQLDGRRGVTAPGNWAVQVPSEPSRGQEPPPSARIVTFGFSSAAGSKRGVPSVDQPIQVWRRRNVTLRLVRRASQARSRGEAFIARGKIRPLLPVKTGWPRASDHAMRAEGGKARMAGSSHGRAVP